MAHDVNIACADDGDETPGLAAYILMSCITCGFYNLYWYYKIANRLSANAPQYGLNFSINDSAFEGCTSLSSVTIPDGVTAIENYTFCGCTGLKSVTIPDSVKNIGGYAFEDCASLTELTISAELTDIGARAFYGCDKLSVDGNIVVNNVLVCVLSQYYDTNYSVDWTVPENVTSIGHYAFSGCAGLTSVIIPDGVTSIGYSAFYGCTRLAEVYYEGSEEEWAEIFVGSYYTGLTSATIYYNYDE